MVAPENAPWRRLYPFESHFLELNGGRLHYLDEGRLFFSVEKGRPVYFELEGSMTTERNTERDIGDRHMSMSSTEEGTFTHTVTVTEAESE